ncbi:MAG: hypothetical protein EOM08_08050 [Clostridia bacterium]|nr:hypothetical protein [Clostridia bacterium]
MIHFERRKHTRLNEDQLIRYLENKIRGDEKAELESILAHCPPCREDLEHLRRWLPYRTMAQKQIPASDPTPEFTTRLLETIRIETDKTAHKDVQARTWRPRPAQLRRLGLVAASLVVLAGLWSIYALATQSGRSTALPPETTAAAMLEQAADMAVPEAALMPDGTAADAAGNAKGLMEPQPETQPGQMAEARLFSAPVQSWFAIAEDFVLPVYRQSAPDVPVLAGEILPEARFAIWVEPDRLIVAWPVVVGEDPAESIAAATADLAPPVNSATASAAEAEQLLSDWLTTEAAAAWQVLQHPDCLYLILEFGGN